MGLSVVCVRWGDKFSADYVNILYDAVRKNLDADFEFICVTDDLDAYDDGIKTIKLPDGLTGWWGKLWLFSEVFQEQCQDRILFFDLDTIIVGDLEEIASYNGEFCILEDFYRPKGYGSGLMAWKKGFGYDIWEKWIEAGKPEVDGGDQAWIERCVQDADRWQHLFPDYVVSFKEHAEQWMPDKSKIICFHGFPKPDECKDGWVPLVWRKGGLTNMKMTGQANVTTDYMLENVRYSVKLDYPWFTQQPAHNGTAVIVGGSPSLNDNIENIRNRKKRGQTIFALNNALNKLMSCNIEPDYSVMMDARPQNAEFMKEGHDVKYLINAVCHKDVFDALEGKNVTIWHSFIANEEEHLKILEAHSDKPVGVLGTGNTVGLTCMVVAFMLGYRKIHLYGMDSSYNDTSHHAYEQKLNDMESTFPVFANGKEYRCSRWMLKQAQDFQDMFRLLVTNGCTISAHGNGLLPDVCSHMNEQWLHQLEKRNKK